MDGVDQNCDGLEICYDVLVVEQEHIVITLEEEQVEDIQVVELHIMVMVTQVEVEVLIILE